MKQLPEEISVQTLKDLHEKKVNLTLLDVREPWEINICNIEGSINIPLQKLLSNPSEITLHLDDPIVVYCHHGVRSKSAVIFLKAQGYKNITNLQGGIDTWSRQIDKNIPTY